MAQSPVVAGVSDDLTILVGDCIESMRALPDGCVHTCITSPPYYGLRDYGHAGQIGLEPTPEAYVDKMVEVFREVRRVLRDDGTVWLNLGDSYARQAGPEESKLATSYTNSTGHRRVMDEGGSVCKKNVPPVGLKPKDLIGIPWRVAFALQADGWWLRQDIIWAKPNPMPESVTDRCTKAHEYIFLLSKSASYYYDADAIKEPSVNTEAEQAGKRIKKQHKGQSDPGGKRETTGGFTNTGYYPTRNKRSVWTVTTKPYKGAHFATFPPDLIRPCVLAGSPVGGTVLDPFGGSGTTGMVALQEGRRAILCELNPDYVAMAEARCRVQRPLMEAT